MHALLIQFHSDLTGEQLMQTLPADWMGSLLTTDGLVMKAFVGTSPNDYGGFYVFADADAAQAYLDGPTWQAIASSPAVTDVEVQHFLLAPEPSRLCGTPVGALATA